MYKNYIKRLFDIICSLLAMIIFCWLYAIIAILVRIKLGSPVIFKQIRVGRNEKPFELYKFRSMSDEKDKNGNLLPDKDRLTKFGRMLRVSSLDELPEAWNIFKGDMSVIGPRPWGTAYLPYYTEEERHRHDVRPGLSGLAQIHGRTAASWDERLKYDIYYVKHLSFVWDIKILLLTVKKVFEHTDVAGAEVQGNFDDYRKRQLGKDCNSQIQAKLEGNR